MKLFQNAINSFAEHFPIDGPDPFFGYTNNLGKLCKLDVQVLEWILFPCSSEIFLKISLKIRTKILPHPLGSELTSFINLHHNSIYIGMTTNNNLRHLTTHLASCGPKQRNLVDYQQQLTRSSQQYKNIISWLKIINHSSLKPSSYEIFSHPLINNRCIGMNSALKLFTQLIPKPTPSY